jgi:two-component system LytT family response regulator
MPRLDGFGVIAGLPDTLRPVIVFTTAHDEHAVRAFEVHALDYLLKPFKAERFRRAVERARAQSRSRREVDGRGLEALAAELRAKQTGGPRILIKSPERIVFLRAAEIDWVEAAGNYVVVHVGSETHITRDTMSAMEKRLAEAGFFRASRSAIVNLQRIRELQPAEAGQYSAVLKSGARIGLTCSLREIQDRLATL